MQGYRGLREARVQCRGFLFELGLLREHFEPPPLDLALLRGRRLEKSGELRDLALEQAQLLLENGLLRAPVRAQQVLLVLEIGPLLRERVDFPNRVRGFLRDARRRQRRDHYAQGRVDNAMRNQPPPFLPVRRPPYDPARLATRRSTAVRYHVAIPLFIVGLLGTRVPSFAERPKPVYSPSRLRAGAP